MVQSKAKQKLEKAKKDEAESKKKLQLATERRESLETELYCELGKRLMKRLKTNDIDALETFIDRLTPEDLLEPTRAEMELKSTEPTFSVEEGGIGYDH